MYDGYDDLSLEKRYTFSNDWEIESKVDYNYNNAIDYSDLIIPSDLYWNNNLYFKHMFMSYIWSFWDNSGNLFYPVFQGNFYYSEHDPYGLPDFPGTSISVYPNPANDYIIVDGYDETDESIFQIYDVNGRLRSVCNISLSNRIPLNNLNNGIYFYKIISAKINYSGKIIIEKK